MRGTFGVAVLLALVAGSGCTNTQLRITTINQGSTLTDLHYHMVLHNLATFAENQASIPWHLAITLGTAQVADAGTFHATPGWLWSLTRASSYSTFGTGISNSRTIVQQWSTNPIVHADALKILQLAYQRAYGSQQLPDTELLDDLAHDIKKQIIATEDLKTESALFYQSQYAKDGKSYDTVRRQTKSTVGEQSVVTPGGGPEPLDDRQTPLAREVAREVNDIIQDLQKVPAGWFGVGRWHDVPKNARYVAHEGKTYVWVSPENVEEMSKFTMLILDIASAVQEPESLTVQGGGLSFSPGFTAPQ